MTPDDTEAACTAIAVAVRTLRERMDAGDDDAEILTSAVAEIDRHIALLPTISSIDPAQAGRCAELLRAADADRRCCLEHLVHLRESMMRDAASAEHGHRASRAYRAVAGDDARFVDRQS